MEFAIAFVCGTNGCKRSFLETKPYLALPEGSSPAYFIKLGARQAEGVCVGIVSHQ